MHIHMNKCEHTMRISHIHSLAHATWHHTTRHNTTHQTPHVRCTRYISIHTTHLCMREQYRILSETTQQTLDYVVRTTLQSFVNARVWSRGLVMWVWGEVGRFM